jgi:hypothetical protein
MFTVSNNSCKVLKSLKNLEKFENNFAKIIIKLIKFAENLSKL